MCDDHEHEPAGDHPRTCPHGAQGCGGREGDCDSGPVPADYNGEHLAQHLMNGWKTTPDGKRRAFWFQDYVAGWLHHIVVKRIKLLEAERDRFHNDMHAEANQVELLNRLVTAIREDLDWKERPVEEMTAEPAIRLMASLKGAFDRVQGGLDKHERITLEIAWDSAQHGLATLYKGFKKQADEIDKRNRKQLDATTILTTLTVELDKLRKAQLVQSEEHHLRRVKVKEVEAQLAATSVKLEHVRNELSAEKEKLVKQREVSREVSAASTEREKGLADQLRTVQLELDGSRAQLAAAGPALPPSSTENGRLRHELQSALTKITQLAPLQGQLKQAHLRLAPANHRARELESTLSKTQIHLIKVQRQLAVKTNEVSLIADEATRAAELVAKKEVTMMQRTISELTSELADSRVTISRLESTISSHETTIASASDTLSSNKSIISRLNTDVAILQQSIEAKMSNLARPEAFARIVELEGEKAAVVVEKENLSKDMECLLEELKTKESSLNGQIARLKAEQEVRKGAFELRLAELESKMADSERDRCGEIDELLTRNESLQSELTRLQAAPLGPAPSPSPPNDVASPLDSPIRLEMKHKASTALVNILRSKLSALADEIIDLRETLASEREANEAFQLRFLTTLSPHLERLSLSDNGSNSDNAGDELSEDFGLSLKLSDLIMGDTGLLSPPMSPDSNDRQRLFGGGAEVTTRDDEQ